MPKPRFLKLILLQAAILLFCSATQAQSISGKLVYADDPGRIQIINADGTGQTDLTAGGSVLDDNPVYSPDGSRIAFNRRSGSKTEVCVMNADGTNVVTITSGDIQPESHNSHPSWSPDGTKLVFFSNRSGFGKTEIWMANADGSVVVTIIDDEVRIFTEVDSDRALALNTATLVVEPFTLTTEPNFSADHRTRISLFVEDLRVHQTFPTIIVEAVDAQQTHFQLPLEIVAFHTVLPFQQLIVRLPENLSTGTLFVTVSVNGGLSNTARISIKP